MITKLFNAKGVQVLGAILLSSMHASAFQFTTGDLYFSDASTKAIYQYDLNGIHKGTLALNPSMGRNVRGLAFGQNGLLYTVMPSLGVTGYSVYAFDQFGNSRATYQANTFFNGNLGNGKIAFGPDSKFYVSGGDVLTSFSVGETEGTPIYTENRVVDAKVLPSGNLLVLSAYTLKEITPSGQIVREIVPTTRLSNARGLEYDHASGFIFVMNGGTSATGFYQLMKINGSSGQVVATRTVEVGVDILLTSSNKLVVGNPIEVPGVYDLNLNVVGATGAQGHMFVTQMPVPEPAFASALLFSAFLLRRRRKQAK